MVWLTLWPSVLNLAHVYVRRPFSNSIWLRENSEYKEWLNNTGEDLKEQSFFPSEVLILVWI